MNYAHALSKMLAGTMQVPEAEIVLETPSDGTLGHFAFPCFKPAKAYKKAPAVIAQEVAAKLSESRPPWLVDIKPTGSYINFFLNRAEFAREVLTTILEAGETYGSSNVGAGKNVLVEYSSPNMAKHFHMGHLGTTIIGQSIYKIFKFLGYNATSLNYLGDWGTQYGKLISAYLKWGSKEAVEKDGLDELTRLYVKFHTEADQDASLNDEARAWVVKMQDGNEEGLALWRWFNEISMAEYHKIYARLNVSFDMYRGESYYSDKMEAAALELTEKGLLVESDGAKIVDLEAYGMPPCLILRRDGGTLYPTRDIAAAIDRYNTFQFDQSLYVTGNEQSLHFAQWMKVVELMGYPWAKNIHHISYGMYLFESGKLSTRRGEVIKIVDLINEAVAKTLALIEEKNPDLPDKAEIAEQVGVGAIIFNKLYNSRIKDTMFSWERMLSFDGETGPYVQYTHARACSVIQKNSTLLESNLIKTETSESPYFFPVHGDLLTEDEAFAVIRLLYDFPNCIQEACATYEPFIIARQLVALAQAYNAFYHKYKVLVDDSSLRQARLALTDAVRLVLKTGLALLGIQAPQEM